MINGRSGDARLDGRFVEVVGADGGGCWSWREYEDLIRRVDDDVHVQRCWWRPGAMALGEARWCVFALGAEGEGCFFGRVHI